MYDLPQNDLISVSDYYYIDNTKTADKFYYHLYEFVPCAGKICLAEQKLPHLRDSIFPRQQYTAGPVLHRGPPAA